MPRRSFQLRFPLSEERSTKPSPLLSRSSSALINWPSRKRSCFRWKLMVRKYSSSSSRCRVRKSVVNAGGVEPLARGHRRSFAVA